MSNPFFCSNCHGNYGKIIIGFIFSTIRGLEYPGTSISISYAFVSFFGDHEQLMPALVNAMGMFIALGFFKGINFLFGVKTNFLIKIYCHFIGIFIRIDIRKCINELSSFFIR